jgi:hypothetical protein
MDILSDLKSLKIMMKKQIEVCDHPICLINYLVKTILPNGLFSRDVFFLDYL